MSCEDRIADEFEHILGLLQSKDENSLWLTLCGMERVVPFAERNSELAIFLNAMYGHWCLAQDENCAIAQLNRLSNPSAIAKQHLSNLYYRTGQPYKALKPLSEILHRNPDDRTARYNRSLNLLMTGDFAAGWRDFECRPEAYSLRNVWRGEDIQDKHLLLHMEGGIGDSIQFMRFIPELAERCARLSVYERPELLGLLTASFTLPNVAFRSEVPADVDCSVLTLSLGHLLRLNHTNVGRSPYLHAVATDEWRQRLRDVAHPRVGLVWAGASILAEDRRRSIPFATIQRMLDVPVGWVSLQVGRDDHDDRMFDTAPYLSDWSETAAAIAILDVVVTVDTAVAHLAGAMGKPVWLLNRWNTCWRWGAVGETTPWYPSMRIVRQPKMGDWASVIEMVRVHEACW